MTLAFWRTRDVQPDDSVKEAADAIRDAAALKMKIASGILKQCKLMEEAHDADAHPPMAVPPAPRHHVS